MQLFFFLSGTFHHSLQSHLQYLVLMGNFGGSAMNEVRFPLSAHPRSRNRTTKTFFLHYRDCLHQLFHPKHTFLTAVLLLKVCQDRILTKTQSGSTSMDFCSVWHEHFLDILLQHKMPHITENIHECSVFQRRMKNEMKAPQLFSVYFCMCVSETGFFGSSGERKCD